MDYLAIIRRIMDEHKAVVERFKLAGESLNDREALTGLEKVREDLMADFKSTAFEKQEKLEQALTLLENGLKNHYDFEEEALPFLMGELLTEALTLEHKQLLSGIEQARSVIKSVRLEGLSRDEQLNEESVMYGLINRLRRQKEDHLNREEAILIMLQKALEERAKENHKMKFKS